MSDEYKIEKGVKIPPPMAKPSRWAELARGIAGWPRFGIGKKSFRMFRVAGGACKPW